LKLSKTIADPSQRCVLLNCVDSMVRQGFISGAKRANPRARSKKKEGAV
jgi:adenosyl cobinamide kinase/adenosyl cobinamide phosphate guanylyltransferase